MIIDIPIRAVTALGYNTDLSFDPECNMVKNIAAAAAEATTRGLAIRCLGNAHIGYFLGSLVGKLARAMEAVALARPLHHGQSPAAKRAD